MILSVVSKNVSHFCKVFFSPADEIQLVCWSQNNQNYVTISFLAVLPSMLKRILSETWSAIWIIGQLTRNKTPRQLLSMASDEIASIALRPYFDSRFYLLFWLGVICFSYFPFDLADIFIFSLTLSFWYIFVIRSHAFSLLLSQLTYK